MLYLGVNVTANNVITIVCFASSNFTSVISTFPSNIGSTRIE